MQRHVPKQAQTLTVVTFLRMEMGTGFSFTFNYKFYSVKILAAGASSTKSKSGQNPQRVAAKHFLQGTWTDQPTRQTGAAVPGCDHQHHHSVAREPGACQGHRALCTCPSPPRVGVLRGHGTPGQGVQSFHEAGVEVCS